MNDTDTQLIFKTLDKLCALNLPSHDKTWEQVSTRMHQLREAEQKPVDDPHKCSVCGEPVGPYCDHKNTEHQGAESGKHFKEAMAEQKHCLVDYDPKITEQRLVEISKTIPGVTVNPEINDTEPLPPSESPECVLAFHLSMVLPMAKGYAAANPIGRNQEIVNRASEIMEAFNRSKDQ